MFTRICKPALFFSLIVSGFVFSAAAEYSDPAFMPPPKKKAKPKTVAQAYPANIDPVDVQPIKVTPAEVKPVQVDPTQVKPVQVDPAVITPADIKKLEVDKNQVKPFKANPVKVEPFKIETDPAQSPKSGRNKRKTEPKIEVKAKPVPRQKKAFSWFRRSEPKKDVVVNSQKELSEARALFNAGDYTKAARVYESIPTNAAEYLRSREELAWTYLQAEDWTRLRGVLPHLNTPMVPLRFRLEGRVLAAMMHLKDCRYEDVKTEIQKFQQETGRIASTVDRKKSGSENTEYWRALDSEVREAIFKMRFVKMELRSRLVMLSRDQAVAGQTSKEAGGAKLASNAQTYPDNGDVWSDEIFKVRGSGESACPQIHSAKVIR
jgi:hypothetical protein